MKQQLFGGIFIVIILSAATLPAFADDLGRFEFGIRGNIVTVDGGEPTNDMSGGGILMRYRFKDYWLVAAGIDYYAGFDVEEPAAYVGVYQDRSVKTIDASADAITISTWIERRFSEDPKGGLSWFVTGGLGVSIIDVDNAKGTTLTKLGFNFAH
jgi:hypothetical protein